MLFDPDLQKALCQRMQSMSRDKLFDESREGILLVLMSPEGILCSQGI